MPRVPSVNESDENRVGESASAARAPNKAGGISRTVVNFWLDTALAVNFLALVWVSFVLRFVFPRSADAAGWSLWGYGYGRWQNLQFGLLSVLLFGVVVHVMLHWTWVCGVITGHLPKIDGKPRRWDDGTRTLLGVGLIVVLLNVLGALMALAALMVQSPLD